MLSTDGQLKGYNIFPFGLCNKFVFQASPCTWTTAEGNVRCGHNHTMSWQALEPAYTSHAAGSPGDFVLNKGEYDCRCKCGEFSCVCNTLFLFEAFGQMEPH